MCGVFGFIGKDGRTVNIERLQQIARVTERRGPHSWGMAWVDADGRMRMFKQVGRITDSLPLLEMARDAVALIGHCRYTTHGATNHTNAHPHPADGGWIVHNGMIMHYEDLIDGFDLHPTTECDSETIGLLVEETEGTLEERFAEAVGHCATTRPFACLGIWKPGIVHAARFGNPLNVGRLRNGSVYLASLPQALPGRVSQFPDQSIISYAATHPETETTDEHASADIPDPNRSSRVEDPGAGDGERVGERGPHGRTTWAQPERSDSQGAQPARRIHVAPIGKATRLPAERRSMGVVR